MLDHDIQLIVEIYCWDWGKCWTWQCNCPFIWQNISLTKWQFNHESVLYFCCWWFLKFWSWLCILNKVHDLVFLVIQEKENCCWQLLLTTTKLNGLASLDDQFITTWSSIRELPFRLSSVLRHKIMTKFSTKTIPMLQSHNWLWLTTWSTTSVFHLWHSFMTTSLSHGPYYTDTKLITLLACTCLGFIIDPIVHV